jgi:hypothetical protein
VSYWNKPTRGHIGPHHPSHGDWYWLWNTLLIVTGLALVVCTLARIQMRYVQGTTERHPNYFHDADAVTVDGQRAKTRGYE